MELLNDLISVLMDMRSGAVAADINEKFNDVLKAVLDTGGKGELVIKLKITPSKFGMGGAVLEIETEHECKMQRPELKVGKALFFVSREGKLSREHPDQANMGPMFNEQTEGKRD
jgi:hypothetical protein